MNPRGDAVVAWNGAGIKGVWFSDRPAGALFSTPRRIANGSAPHVAVNGNGTATNGHAHGPHGQDTLTTQSEREG